jgi:hypothetical protein
MTATAAAKRQRIALNPAGAADLLNDVLMSLLGTAPAIGVPDLACVLPNRRAWFERIICNRRYCDLSLDG